MSAATPTGSAGIMTMIDGTVIPPGDAASLALDRGLLYGDAVFEVLVAYGQRLVDADRHLARLRESAEQLRIPVPWQDADLGFQLAAVAARVAAPKCWLRLTVTRGDGLGVVPPEPPAPPRVIIHGRPVAPDAGLYKNGVSLRRTQRPAHLRGAQPKVPGLYGLGMPLLMRARAEGYDDVLWSGPDSDISETSSANVFLIGRLGDQVEIITPPAAAGLLPGLTRATMLRLLTEARIPAREQSVHADELARFDEAFLTSSVRGLVPVNRIDRHQLHTARERSVFRQIERLYAAWIKVETGLAVDWRTGLPPA